MSVEFVKNGLVSALVKPMELFSSKEYQWLAGGHNLCKITVYKDFVNI